MFPFRLLSALKNRRERRSGRVPQPAVQARRAHVTLNLEPLEDRCLMSAGAAVINDSPAPVGATTAFAVGIGPGMQLDLFETDRAGQVFTQPVLNLFGQHGATTFINSQVEIPTLRPQDDGPPVTTIKGINGQQYPGWLTNPSDPHIFGPAMNALFSPFTGFPSPFGGGGNSPNGAPSTIVGTYTTVDHPAATTAATDQDQHVTITINANNTATVSIPDFSGGVFMDTLPITVTDNGNGTWSVRTAPTQRSPNLRLPSVGGR